MAKGSHSPSLLTLVRRVIRHDVPLQGMHVLVACSGGPDSTALLHVLTLLRARIDVRISAHAVDHGLRPEAAMELDALAELAGAWGVSLTRTRLELKPGGNLQARARDARYEALEAAAATVNADLIATGHTADDRAETVLMRLLRGAGPRGLAVLPPRSGDRVRPLIRAGRGDVMRHLRRHRIPFAQDPSNVDKRFLRARVRADLLPQMAEMSPRITEHLCRLADDLAHLPEPPGALLGLGRRQTEQALRMLRSGRSARVRVSGGREVDLVFDETGTNLVEVHGRKGSSVHRAGATVLDPCNSDKKLSTESLTRDPADPRNKT